MGDYVKRCVSAATVHGNPGVTEILLGERRYTRARACPFMYRIPRLCIAHKRVYVYIRCRCIVYLYIVDDTRFTAAAIAVTEGHIPRDRSV